LGGSILNPPQEHGDFVLSCRVALPSGFRVADVLAFHRRDPQAVAERVDADAVQKGLRWGGGAARLTIRFHASHADAELAVDRRAETVSDLLETLVGRMLGLAQPVEEFESLHRGHPQIGGLIARQSGLRVPLTATPFEALTWAVTGQQISVLAAVAARRKLILLAGGTHSSGLACYPDASRIVGLDETVLRAAGFSQTKARTLLTLSRLVVDGELPLDDWVAAPPVEEIRTRLLAVKGIGPWTVNYALLRGFGWLDGSLHGDAAVRRGMQILLGLEDRVSADQTRDWLAGFSPWRALVGAHLWALKSAQA
jgi:DNA-3-methyladenine glycosylase II